MPTAALDPPPWPLPETEVERLLRTLAAAESEQTWTALDGALVEMGQRWLQMPVAQASVAQASVSQASSSAQTSTSNGALLLAQLTSDRTRLSGSACEVVDGVAEAVRRVVAVDASAAAAGATAVAQPPAQQHAHAQHAQQHAHAQYGHPHAHVHHAHHGHDLATTAAIADLVMPALLKLVTRANKVSVQRASKSIENVMRGVPGAQRQLTRLVAAMRSPNKALRTAAIRAVLILLEEHLARNSGTGNGGVFLDDHVSDVETALRAGLTDAESAVREMARAAYHMFSQAFVQRAHGFEATLPPNTLKYLSQPASRQASPAKARVVVQRPFAAARIAPVHKEHVSASTAFSGAFTPAKNGSVIMPSLDTGSANKGPQQPPMARIRSMAAFGGGSAMKAQRLVPARLKGESAATAEGTSVSASISSGPQRLVHKGPLRVLPVKSETPSTAAPVHESTIAKNVDDVAELTSADTLVSAIVEKPQSHSHHRPATARARIPVPSSNPVPSSKHDVEAEPTAEPTSRSVDAIIRDASASDWSKRMQAFEELSVHLTSSSPDLATNMTVPIYDAIISGLGDPHFRVVRSVLACTELCLKADGLPVKYHDLMLPALLNVCEDPQIKSKPEIAASAASCLQALCSSVKPEQLVHSLLQVLNAPDFRQNVRIRQGCIVRLAATVEHAAGYFSKVSITRSALSRLVANDIDKTSKSFLRTIFLAIHGFGNSMFFDSVAALSPTERKRIRDVVAKDLPKFDARTDERSRRLQRSLTLRPTSSKPMAKPLVRSRSFKDDKSEDVPNVTELAAIPHRAVDVPAYKEQPNDLGEGAAKKHTLHGDAAVVEVETSVDEATADDMQTNEANVSAIADDVIIQVQNPQTSVTSIPAIVHRMNASKVNELPVTDDAREVIAVDGEPVTMESDYSTGAITPDTQYDPSTKPHASVALECAPTEAAASKDDADHVTSTPIHTIAEAVVECLIKDAIHMSLSPVRAGNPEANFEADGTFSSLSNGSLPAPAHTLSQIIAAQVAPDERKHMLDVYVESVNLVHGLEDIVTAISGAPPDNLRHYAHVMRGLLSKVLESPVDVQKASMQVVAVDSATTALLKGLVHREPHVNRLCLDSITMLAKVMHATSDPRFKELRQRIDSFDYGACKTVKVMLENRLCAALTQ